MLQKIGKGYIAELFYLLLSGYFEAMRYDKNVGV